MAAERLEPFRQALVDLRRRLRDGRLSPGARVTAKDVADRLKLSPTPVREALSRLAGEGLLEERRGDGFFVPQLSAADIAVLYRLSETLLLAAQAGVRDGRRATCVGEALRRGDPVEVVEKLFGAWAAETGSRVAVETCRTVTLRLAPVRRLEAALIDDLAQEAEALLALAAPRARGRAGAIQHFHRRRIALAQPLAELLARGQQERGE